jgi:alkanesulfonate monooxygenase SsuD/methylene tetrahydromethanopterin reductase-like flavin-dependent oxidoreductase (luciferase family)
LTRFGFQLPTFDPLKLGGPQKFVEAARLGEEAGFDAVWVGDHLYSPAPNYEASVALAAAAAVTERIELGFGVMLLGLRPTAWAAKQLQTLDALAPGRLLLGVGVGGEFPEEFAAVGLSTKRRGRLLDDALAVLPALLQGREAQLPDPTGRKGLDGEPEMFAVPALAPPVSALPAVYVAGRGEPAMARAARIGDWWMPTWLTPEKTIARRERLTELAQEHGRPVPKIAFVLGAHVDADEGRARQRASTYIEGMYKMPFERVEHWIPVGSPQRVAEAVRAQCEAGVEEIVFTLLGDDPLPQIEALAAVRELCSGR